MKNPTPLQLLARQQNWNMFMTKGLLANLEQFQRKYEGKFLNAVVSAHLNRASAAMEAAIYSMEIAHKVEREELAKKIKQPQIPQRGKE